MKDMNLRKNLASLLSFATLCVSASSLSAQVISINFSGNTDPANQVVGMETAGLPAVGSFNNLTGASGSSIGLINDSGAASGTSVTFQGGFYNANSKTTGMSAGDISLFKDSLHQNGTFTTTTVSLANISHAAYDVYVYFSTPFGARQFSASINGDSSTQIFGLGMGGASDQITSFSRATATTSGNAVRSNYILWENVSGAALSIAAPRSSDGSVGISGVQIVAVPEPTTVGMLIGAGIVLLVVRRRRSRRA